MESHQYYTNRTCLWKNSSKRILLACLLSVGDLLVCLMKLAFFFLMLYEGLGGDNFKSIFPSLNHFDPYK